MKFWERIPSEHRPKPKPKQWTADKYAKFYHTTTWRNLRKLYIVNNPVCEKCKFANMVVQAQVVDHIVPIKDGGEPLEWSNLQSLCHSCHNSKSVRERT